MLLREQGEQERLLPIMIGGAEAAAIHTALEGVVPPRPMTHDLFVDVLRATGLTVDRVVISAMQDHTFLAELHIHGSDGQFVVSARPSDAVALAVRLDVELFVDEAVLDVAGTSSEHQVEDDGEPSDGEAEHILDEFRSFLDDVSPEDFEK